MESEQQRTTAPKLWVVLARAYGALASFVEGSIESTGMGLSDFMVLEVLLHKGPMPISAIGEKVLLANASMTSAVDRLEARQCVVRTKDPLDRRVRRIELTATGRAFIEKMYAQHASDIEEVVGVLTADEQDELRASLKKLGLAAKAASESRKK